jgi:hypothetical protein
MKKKVFALTLAALVACSVTGCGGGDKKPEPKPETKQTTNVKKDEKQKKPEKKEKKENPARVHAQEVMKLPHVAKYDKISKEAYPKLTWGSTGYNYKDYPGKGKEGKNALLDYGEVIAGFHRTLSSDDRPTFKLDDGREVKGSENYDIEVLVGGCKGNCVIEATSTYTKRLDPASYKKPIVEKKVLQPFDKTYVRHNENGKKWVTHEKCGTK